MFFMILFLLNFDYNLCKNACLDPGHLFGSRLQNSSYPNRMDPIRNTAINPFCDLFPVTSVSDPDPSEIRI